MHRFTYIAMQDKLLSIGKASKLLGVSIDTLRRWDAAGKLSSIRGGPRGYRFYRQSDIDSFLQSIEAIARNWAETQSSLELDPAMYCQTRDIFQVRLETFKTKFSKIVPVETVALITAITGEIGNNSFDHNLGNWPDVPGIFFSYNFRDGKVVLADRGQGVLTTLKRVRPELTGSSEAIKVAFTETISGRYPETRGNGLKFVKSIIVGNPFTLYFQTGDAALFLKKNDDKLLIQSADKSMKGCFAVITF